MYKIRYITVDDDDGIIVDLLNVRGWLVFSNARGGDGGGGVAQGLLLILPLLSESLLWIWGKNCPSC